MSKASKANHQSTSAHAEEGTRRSDRRVAIAIPIPRIYTSVLECVRMYQYWGTTWYLTLRQPLELRRRQ